MTLNPTQVKFFADFIQKELGIVYAPENYFQLEKRLSDICRNLNIPSEDELFKKAQAGITGFFRQLLLDVATNNETSFYRDPKIFSAFEKHVVPGVRARNPKLPVIRLWCAASSFGQEPYSLAMLVSEMAAKDATMPRFEIVATDISDTALKRAKEGRYSQLEVQRGLPAPLMVKYFAKTRDDYWEIKPEIRVSVQFRKQNLLEPFSTLGDFEIVFCRNVLIYQTEARKKEIIARIAERIRPGGILVLGAAESLIGITDRFEQVFNDGAVYFQRKP